jgi:hypothetical protein
MRTPITTTEFAHDGTRNLTNARLSRRPRRGTSPSFDGQLWALWDDHFDERPGHHHRVWLESRLAYRMQERAFGGLKPSVRKKLEEIGETGMLPKQLRAIANRLLPGTILTRIYDDVEHRVLVRGSNDFEYQGQRFKSLTALPATSRAATGQAPCSSDSRTKKEAHEPPHCLRAAGAGRHQEALRRSTPASPPTKGSTRNTTASKPSAMPAWPSSPASATKAGLRGRRLRRWRLLGRQHGAPGLRRLMADIEAKRRSTSWSSTRSTA